MVPIPGNSWTKRRFGHAVARVRPNQSFQPTSHSSLRSSCAAAELHRYASKREEVMASRAGSPAVGGALFARSKRMRGSKLALVVGCTSSEAARAVPADASLQAAHCSVMVPGGSRTGLGCVHG
jgi:hypothetical protein